MALIANTGAQVWNYSYITFGGMWDGVYSAPAVLNGTLYVITVQCGVLAFNATTGTLKWRIPSNYLSTSCSSSVSVSSDGLVYFTTEQSNSLYCLDGATGAVVWKFTGAATINYQAPIGPSLGLDRTIYVSSKDGFLYALGQYQRCSSEFRTLPRADLSGTLIKTTLQQYVPNAILTASDCQAQCCATPGCDSFTFAPFPALFGGYNCYLYANVTAVIPNSAYTSGVNLAAYPS